MNGLSRVSLVPREAVALTENVQIAWNGDAFELELPNVGRRVLGATDRFRVGSTEIEFACTSRSWPVDLERERALMERDEASAWSVYADELLTIGDPLGARIAKTSGFDVAFALDVSPLVARRAVDFRADDRGLWREATFRHDLSRAALEARHLEAVLTHPMAWFLQRVTIELKPTGRSYRAALIDAARIAASAVGRSAGPHLTFFSVPRFPARESLPRLRDGVTVVR